MNVLLTQKQTAMLEELFSISDADSESGEPGMIAGQFFRSAEGEGYFIATYIDHEKSVKLLKSLQLPVKHAPCAVEVYTDIE